MFSLIYVLGDINLRMHKNNIHVDIGLSSNETTAHIFDTLKFNQSVSLSNGKVLPIDDEMGWKLWEASCVVEELKICEKMWEENLSIVIEKEHFDTDISKNAKKIHTFLHKNVSAKTYEQLKEMFK